MSEEKNEVALASLPSVPTELEAAFIDDNFIDGLIKNIRTKASAVVGDLNTVKGRKVYISMAADVRSTKAMIDEAGKNLVAEMKKRPAMVDASRRKVREALDELAVQIRKPVTDWEAEQERLAAEKQMQEWHEQALADNEAFDQARIERFEADHELALLMNTQHDREVADAKAEAERQRIAHEEELKRQAAEQAQREADEKIRREREASAKREADLKAQAEQAERDRIALAQKAEQDRIDAAAKAEADRLAAAQQAEREKQEAIAAEQLKAKQEADRIQREVKQKEDARLAEEKRIADEAAARAADVAHRKTIGTDIVNDLLDNAKIERVQAIQILTALKDGNIRHTTIHY